MDSLGCRERNAFAASLLEVGPDAPTCCAGWTAEDICIHLVLFQNRPDTWAGHALGDRSPRARSFYDRLVDTERSRRWPELVERLRCGPRFGPLALPAVRDRMFLREYIVHHEDVRRANGLPPRTNVDDLQIAAWKKLPGFVRMVQPRQSGVDATWPGRERQSLRRGGRRVELVGEPIDILLLLFGRSGASEVQVQGPDDLVDSFRIRDTSTLRALPRVRTDLIHGPTGTDPGHQTPTWHRPGRTRRGSPRPQERPRRG